MKTAISIPDDDFARFERVAASHGYNRSEFFQLAGRRFADELAGESELTARADAAIDAAGQPSGDGTFLDEAHRIIQSGSDW
ncbi:MAG TPA: ribbon-helix-helix domain-containing protein [Pseudolysinimonas sp.]|nr:ribbon-helix-helix domain-containing protein [Pseudolysinimonas sp.]